MQLLLPSENEAVNGDSFKILLYEIVNNLKNKIKIIITNNIKKSHFIFTEVAIPIVITAKYTDNWKGDLTGFLNLTIDKAPTMPRDKAIFPEIIEVII